MLKLFGELPLRSTPLRSSPTIWPCLRRKTWSRGVPHQDGSKGCYPSPNGTNALSYAGPSSHWCPSDVHQKEGAENATDDQVMEVMGAATKKARTVAAPKTPPKAAPKTPPKAAPKAAAAAKAEPDGKPKSKAAAVAKATCRGESHQPGARLDL